MTRMSFQSCESHFSPQHYNRLVEWSSDQPCVCKNRENLRDFLISMQILEKKGCSHLQMRYSRPWRWPAWSFGHVSLGLPLFFVFCWSVETFVGRWETVGLRYMNRVVSNAASKEEKNLMWSIWWLAWNFNHVSCIISVRILRNMGEHPYRDIHIEQQSSFPN